MWPCVAQKLARLLGCVVVGAQGKKLCRAKRQEMAFQVRGVTLRAKCDDGDGAVETAVAGVVFFFLHGSFADLSSGDPRMMKAEDTWRDCCGICALRLIGRDET